MLNAHVRYAARLAWLWTGLVAVASVALVPSFAQTSGEETPSFGLVIYAIAWLLIPILFTGLGAFIVSRQPGNRIARLLLLIGAAALVDSAASSGLTTPPESVNAWILLLVILDNFAWVAIFFPLFHLLYIFPTGRLLSTRWRWVYFVEAVWIVTLFTLGIFTKEIGPVDESWVVTNPIGFVPTTFFDQGWFGLLWVTGLLSLVGGGGTALTLRYRRSTSMVRQQIKWVLYAGVLFVIGFASQLVLTSYSDEGSLLFLLFIPSIVAIPVTITIAIVRYRLYEIDRIISRTLGYALVIGILGSVYLAGAVYLPARFTGNEASPSFVAATTLAVAALFSPVRRRVLSRVDRRFYRSPYDAVREVDDLMSRLRDRVLVEELSAAWVDSVQRAIHPRAIGVWISEERRHGH